MFLKRIMSITVILLLFLVGCSDENISLTETQSTTSHVCSVEEETTNEPTATSESISEEITTSSAIETTVPYTKPPVYYDKNETINEYLTRYNTLNNDCIIDSSVFSVYSHHGTEHEDQIIFWLDSNEFVITNSYGNRIKLVVTGANHISFDDCYQLFTQFAKAFDLSLSDETLDTYWQELLDDITNNLRFDEFECDLTVSLDDDYVEMMVIEGELK